MNLFWRHHFQNFKRATFVATLHVLLMATGCSDTSSNQEYRFYAKPTGCTAPISFKAIQKSNDLFLFHAENSQCYKDIAPVKMIEIQYTQIKRLTNLAHYCAGVYVADGHEHLFLNKSLLSIYNNSCDLSNKEDEILLSNLKPFLNSYLVNRGIDSIKQINEEIKFSDPFSDLISNDVIAIYHLSSTDQLSSKLCLVSSDPNFGSKSDVIFPYDRILTSRKCVEETIVYEVSNV